MAETITVVRGIKLPTIRFIVGQHLSRRGVWLIFIEQILILAYFRIFHYHRPMKDKAVKEFISHSIEETEAIAAQWLKDISKKYAGKDEALVVGLSGHLGAAKTAFVKAVAKTLGVKEAVTSPTFVLMKIYEIGTNNQRSMINDRIPWKRLIHIDAYRLERPEELEALDWEDVVADRNNLIMVEWPENVGLDESGLSILLKFEIRNNGYHVAELGTSSLIL